MRRDVRAYREHLHVVARGQRDAAAPGGEQEILEAVLAVSPVRLDLDDDGEESLDEEEENPATILPAATDALLRLPPPPPLPSQPLTNWTRAKSPAASPGSVAVSLDEQRVEYDLLQRQSDYDAKAGPPPARAMIAEAPRLRSRSRSSSRSPKRAFSPRPVSPPRPRPVEIRRLKSSKVAPPNAAVAPLSSPAGVREAHPPSMRDLPAKVPAHEYALGTQNAPVRRPPLRSRWREAAQAHRERLKRREKDFVPWTAQRIKDSRHGTETFVALPAAPAPRPRQQRKDKAAALPRDGGPEEPEDEVEIRERNERAKLYAEAAARVKRKRERAVALSIGTQTVPPPQPGPPRRYIVVEHVPVSEQDCLRVLRDDRFQDENTEVSTPPLLPVDTDPRFARLREEKRRIAASFEAIRGILTHRENALMRELAADREELECARAELRKQVLAALTAEQRGPGDKENRPSRPAAPQLAPFVCGVTPAADSMNRQVRTSVAAARRSLAFRAPRQVRDARDAWEGSEFKIKLLEEMIDRLQKRIAFRALSWTARRRLMLRRLCLEREELLRRHALRRAFAGLGELHAARAWLRERAQRRRATRAQSTLRTCWQAWRACAVEAALELGKHGTADTYLRRKTLWRAFAAWRAQPLALERYETVANLCARRFCFETTTRRALLGWRRYTVHSKLVRIRLVCRASGSDIGNQAHVPPAWTDAGVRERCLQACLSTKAALQISLRQSTLDLARGAVATACVAVRRQGILRHAVDRRQAARDAYLQCARAARAAHSSSRARRIAVAPHLPAQLMNLGLGRLSARPLGHLVAALRSFVAGDSLRFKVPTGHERRASRMPRVSHEESPTDDSIDRSARDNPAYAWIHARGPWPDPEWRHELPVALASVRTMRKALRDWRETANAIACVRRGDEAHNALLLLRAWRGLRTNVALEHLRLHLLAWRAVLDRGALKGAIARKRRFFQQWKTLARDRGLLRRVFGLAGPLTDRLTEQYRLLSRIVAAWRHFVEMQKDVRHGVAADLHYTHSLLARTFSTWRVARAESLRRRFLCAGSALDAATARAVLWHM